MKKYIKIFLVLSISICFVGAAYATIGYVKIINHYKHYRLVTLTNSHGWSCTKDVKGHTFKQFTVPNISYTYHFVDSIGDWFNILPFWFKDRDPVIITYNIDGNVSG